MCDICTNIQTYTKAQIERYDPTRTTTLRNLFVAKFNSRFKTLTQLVKESIVGNDCFGLSAELSANMNYAAGRHQFMFPTSTEKAKAFMLWFNAQVDALIFEVGTLQQVGGNPSSTWYNKYIFDSYKRGVQRARWELRKVGVTIPNTNINIAMGIPIHVETLALLYSRVFETLKGITSAMDTQVSIVLTQALADGDGAAVIARKLVGTINGTSMGDLSLTDTLGRFVPAQRRAATLARTEIIRAHHRANIAEYMNWRVEDVFVMYELMTAGDDRVCPQCELLEGRRYKLEEAVNLIPVHPNCRCICLPFEIKKPK